MRLEATSSEFLTQLGETEWIACTLNAPANPRALVIICHGLTGDMLGPGGLQRQLAETLAESGIAVARFDARGCGDSSIAPGQPTVSTMAQDVRAVAEGVHLKKYADLPLIYCGISLGAIAAAQGALTGPRTCGVIAISSDLADGDARPWPPRWAREAEHDLPPGFAEDLSRCRPRGALLARGIPVRVIVGSNDRGASRASHLQEEGIGVEVVERGDHLFQDHTARLDLLGRMRRCVNELLVGEGAVGTAAGLGDT
ncbi:alpha/beta fold hydrolase [Streptomyces sp. MUM 178J]|uniref:alpha/beta hydrolase n=1 Tax=Streptomyces sp. MUM 178J TaxID=2791991 RepID=UPI001F04B5FE